MLINYITVNIDKDVVWLMENDLNVNKLHNQSTLTKMLYADGD